jgi:hypothetical protein
VFSHSVAHFFPNTPNLDEISCSKLIAICHQEKSLMQWACCPFLSVLALSCKFLSVSQVCSGGAA